MAESAPQSECSTSGVTMKIDAPSEDDVSSSTNNSNDQEIEDNEQTSEPQQSKNAEAEFRMCTPSRLPRAATSSSSSSSRGILKPPQLSLNNISSTSNNKTAGFVLNPSRLNPFAKGGGDVTANQDDKEENSVVLNGATTPKFVPLIQSEKAAVSTSSGAMTTVPTATTTVSSTTTTSGSGSFVFGQNLQDRVVADKNMEVEPRPSTSVNGTSSSGNVDNMLFSSAVSSSSSSTSKDSKSLSESAREYEESRASKRKYEEVEVLTGEEGETNIVNITCKLFAFDNKSASSWQERGRGVLRLNDLKGDEESHTQSRLVFRTTGSLRVVLNTKIWAEMTVELAGEKSVRFTALDPNGVVKVFLAMASNEESKQLYNQLQVRVQKEISSQKHKKVSSSGP